MLAIETLLGALTGYFTNDIAIRQLFSKNGVVVREREQFTGLIVQVLTEQIIDEDTVAALKDNPEMATAFTRAVRTLLTEELPFALSDLSLADLDKDGALAALLNAHLTAVDLRDVQLNAALLDERVTSLLAQPAFQESLAVSLKNLARLTPRMLGTDRVLEDWQKGLRGMSDKDWQALLSRWQSGTLAAVMDALDETAGLCLEDVLGIDGETLTDLLIQLVLAHQPSQLASWLDVLKDQGLQEHLYVFAERVLQEVVRLHLPVLMETVYPLLAEDRAQLEEMFLASLGECEAAGPFFRDVALSYFQERFTVKQDEDDWLSAFYKRCSDPEEEAALCDKIAQYLLSWVIWEIDQWRRAGIDSEVLMQKLQAQLAHWRPVLVKLLGMLLKQPLAQSRLLQEGLQAVVGGIFAWIRSSLTPARIAESLNGLHDWLDKPLADNWFDEARQAQIMHGIGPFWEKEGMAWLEAQDLSGEDVRHLMSQLIDWLYHQPLARLLCRSKDQIPYEALADRLREAAFVSLRPFLGRLTKEQLDALSHEEIRQLVLDMIGREMRPLAYLGGGIGAAAGLATGAAMELSGVTPDPDQVALLMAARTGMYGVVGYGTNVMAVCGLFRPYKKTFGMQGLMSKNQARFANKMNELAASYIINEEIWTTQVDRYSQKVNEKFPALVQEALKCFDEKRDKEWLPYAKALLLPHAGAWLYAAVDQAEIGAWMQKLMDKTVAHRDIAKALRWVDTAALYRRGINKLAMLEVKDGCFSRRLIDALQWVDAKTWKEKGNRAFSLVVLPAERDFYEKLWQKLLPYYKGLPELLLENIDALAGLADGILRKRLPFAMQMGYQMAGGKRYLAAVLEIFIGKKLPAYLFRREARIGDLLVDWAMNSVAGRSLAECGLAFSDEEGRWLQDICAGMAPAPVQRFVQEILRRLAAVSEDTAARFTSALAVFGMHLFQQWLGPAEKDALRQGLAALNWAALSGRMAPALVALSEGVFDDLSFDALLSLEDGSIWQALMEALSFDERETAVLTTVGNELWQIVEPAIWAYLVREGQTLLFLIDVPGLVEERIRGLSPALLEDLMRGIAQPYFTRVERMGWLGAVVAIPATVVSRMLGGF